MAEIIIETTPDATRLASLGVDHWPIWEKKNSEFPWEYFETETSYILEAAPSSHRKVARRWKSARATW